MIDRYPNLSGCRLDDGAATYSAGPAIDLHGSLDRKRPDLAAACLWVRESGTSNEDDQVQATCPVSANDLLALRDGINQMLREAGMRGA